MSFRQKLQALAESLNKYIVKYVMDTQLFCIIMQHEHSMQTAQRELI